MHKNYEKTSMVTVLLAAPALSAGFAQAAERVRIALDLAPMMAQVLVAQKCSIFAAQDVFQVGIGPRVLEPLQRHAGWRIDNAKGHGGASTVPDFRRLFDSAPLRQVGPERVSF